LKMDNESEMNIEEILEEINKEKAIITANQERLAALKEKRVWPKLGARFTPA
jgi:hypothetical protein